MAFLGCFSGKIPSPFMAITSEVILISSEVIAISSEVIRISSPFFGRKGHFFRNLSFDKKKYINIFLKRKYIFSRSARARIHVREGDFFFFLEALPLVFMGERKKLRAKRKSHRRWIGGGSKNKKTKSKSFAFLMLVDRDLSVVAIHDFELHD